MSIESAEHYRDQLHDLSNGFTAAEQREVDGMAAELASRKFDKLDRESLRDEWIEKHWQEFVGAAIDQLGWL
jgi:hypothetical protein